MQIRIKTYSARELLIMVDWECRTLGGIQVSKENMEDSTRRSWRNVSGLPNKMCRGGLNSSALMDIVKAVPLDRPCVGKSDDSRLGTFLFGSHVNNGIRAMQCNDEYEVWRSWRITHLYTSLSIYQYLSQKKRIVNRQVY